MEELLGEEWAKVIANEFNKSYMRDLSAFIKQKRFEGIVYPASADVFNAFKSTPFSKVKVCILAQDPYINPGEAHGLAFSTFTGRTTPTLIQLRTVIERDCYNGLNLEWDNNLERWTKQGIFLLNTILTVDQGKSLSHQNKGWEHFTAEVIKKLSQRGDVIFLLWGSYAKAYGHMIDNSKNTVFLAPHPVSASYRNEIWDNGNCFNKVNEIIKGEKIEW